MLFNKMWPVKSMSRLLKGISHLPFFPGIQKKLFSSLPIQQLHEYPFPIFVTPVDETTLALSFLDPATSLTKPIDKHCIGWLKQTELDLCPFDVSQMKENPTFIDKMHKVLALYAEKDQSLISLAECQKQGWLHICDNRNPPPWGRIPDSDDIIGSINVRDGMIIKGSYQPMPTHRLVSKRFGLFRLSPFLQQQLVQSLKQKNSR